MADAMDTLKSILGDNAEDTIKSVMNSLGASGGSPPDNNESTGGFNGAPPQSNGGSASGENSRNPLGNIDPENLAYLMQMRDLMTKFADSRSDSRANLLMSLKPYMRDNRKRSIDSAVRLLNISKLAGLLRM